MRATAVTALVKLESGKVTELRVLTAESFEEAVAGRDSLRDLILLAEFTRQLGIEGELKTAMSLLQTNPIPTSS